LKQLYRVIPFSYTASYMLRVFLILSNPEPQWWWQFAGASSMALTNEAAIALHS